MPNLRLTNGLIVQMIIPSILLSLFGEGEVPALLCFCSTQPVCEITDTVMNWPDFFSSQELMFDSAKTKNVIQATNKPHLLTKLEDLQERFYFHSVVPRFSNLMCSR